MRGLTIFLLVLVFCSLLVRTSLTTDHEEEDDDDYEADDHSSSSIKKSNATIEEDSEEEEEEEDEDEHHLEADHHSSTSLKKLNTTSEEDEEEDHHETDGHPSSSMKKSNATLDSEDEEEDDEEEDDDEDYSESGECTALEVVKNLNISEFLPDDHEQLKSESMAKIVPHFDDTWGRFERAFRWEHKLYFQKDLKELFQYFFGLAYEYTYDFNLEPECAAAVKQLFDGLVEEQIWAFKCK